MKPFVLLLTAVALTGCLTTKPDEQLVNSTTGCDLSYKEQIGSRLVLKQGDTPNPRRLRILLPRQAVSLDYIPTRTNIEVDRNSVVQRVTCG